MSEPTTAGTIATSIFTKWAISLMGAKFMSWINKIFITMLPSPNGGISLQVRSDSNQSREFRIFGDYLRGNLIFGNNFDFPVEIGYVSIRISCFQYGEVTGLIPYVGKLPSRSKITIPISFLYGVSFSKKLSTPNTVTGATINITDAALLSPWVQPHFTSFDLVDADVNLRIENVGNL